MFRFLNIVLLVLIYAVLLTLIENIANRSACYSNGRTQASTCMVKTYGKVTTLQQDVIRVQTVCNRMNIQGKPCHPLKTIKDIFKKCTLVDFVFISTSFRKLMLTFKCNGIKFCKKVNLTKLHFLLCF